MRRNTCAAGAISVGRSRGGEVFSWNSPGPSSRLAPKEVAISVRMRQKANAVSASLSSASTSSGARTEGIGGTGDKRRRGYFAAGVGSLILNVHKGTFGFSCAQFTSDYLLAPDTRPSPRL